MCEGFFCSSEKSRISLNSHLLLFHRLLTCWCFFCVVCSLFHVYDLWLKCESKNNMWCSLMYKEDKTFNPEIVCKMLHLLLYITNKSTQRVYNTFKKGQTPPTLYPRPLLLFLFLFLHNFLSSLLEKKNFVWSSGWTAPSPFHITPSNLIPVLLSPPLLFPVVSFVLS